VTVAPRVIVETDNVINPLADAWVRAFKASGLSVVGLMRSHDPVPAALAENWVAGVEVPHAEIESRLGGRPDVRFAWWGLGFAAGHSINATYPEIRSILCVDTYPNASRPSSELREWLLASRDTRRWTRYVCYTDEMAQMIDRRLPGRGKSKTIVIVQPFETQTHATVDRYESNGLVQSAIFTGRSDCLYTSGRRMQKDALGKILQDYLSNGFSVTVQRPSEPNAERALRTVGFKMYEPFNHSQMLDGTFSNFISGYGCQLALYNEWNTTVRRRVRNGLSSRFALGLTSPSPLVISQGAIGPRRILESRGVGMAVTGPLELKERWPELQNMRQQWRTTHGEWTAEGQTKLLHRIVAE
jgi:hypothetical protein